MAASRVHGSFHVENPGGWLPFAESRYSRRSENWLSPAADGAGVMVLLLVLLVGRAEPMARVRWDYISSEVESE